ncbi:hypothetical protein HYU92_04995 [Candidatus Curtissbacteria bacterium]|nr:hypothetical protein [Candidatus Curtissbacteria bacterium]
MYEKETRLSKSDIAKFNGQPLSAEDRITLYWFETSAKNLPRHFLNWPIGYLATYFLGKTNPFWLSKDYIKTYLEERASNGLNGKTIEVFLNHPNPEVIETLSTNYRLSPGQIVEIIVRFPHMAQMVKNIQQDKWMLNNNDLEAIDRVSSDPRIQDLIKRSWENFQEMANIRYLSRGTTNILP